jgi:hypothetical protein
MLTVEILVGAILLLFFGSMIYVLLTSFRKIKKQCADLQDQNFKLLNL